MYFDSHCHLTDERLLPDAERLLTRARDEGVERVVTIATDPDDVDAACELARRFDGLWATAGIHPHVADRADASAIERVAEALGRPEIVAVGETGLDYHYDNSPRAAQRRSFERHLELAAETGLPVVVHSRDADEDTAAMVRSAEGAVTGVLHCFAGGRMLLDTGLEAGWYVSLSGLITFNSYDGADLVRAIPADRLLVETDSPYLAPVPMRGRPNEPAFVRHVAAAAADLRGDEPDALARRTTRNACAFYSLEED